MPNNEHSSKSDMDKKTTPQGTVGKDVPDESKERHTEIAVEAGRKSGEHDEKEKR
ncbi:MAG TPA: hypothetical protein VHY35_03685 [Stellaceae bacterium]|jgi:hypothetical protein|nr:hypothetical protein [Stellaceae bacterium]